MNKLMTIILISFFSLSLLANEHEEKKEEGEGHGGGHEAAPAAPAATLPPWIAIEAKIQELSSRIKSKEESLQKLLEEKNHLPDKSPHVKEILKEILKQHNELKTMADDYKKNVSMLNYRYPERNAKSGRKYDHIEIKSLTEMEQAMGVDGKLSRNLKKMRAQYGKEKAEEKKQHKSETPVVPKELMEKKNPSIEDEGAIIINK